jgi:hypothetical protein
MCKKFIKRSMKQAYVAAQASEDLARTEAAAKARRKLNESSRRQPAKGGVLYAYQARAIMKERDEDIAHSLHIAAEKADRAYQQKLRDEHPCAAWHKAAAVAGKEWITRRRSREKQQDKIMVEVRTTHRALKAADNKALKARNREEAKASKVRS